MPAGEYLFFQVNNYVEYPYPERVRRSYSDDSDTEDKEFDITGGRDNNNLIIITSPEVPTSLLVPDVSLNNQYVKSVLSLFQNEKISSFLEAINHVRRTIYRVFYYMDETFQTSTRDMMDISQKEMLNDLVKYIAVLNYNIIVADRGEVGFSCMRLAVTMIFKMISVGKVPMTYFQDTLLLFMMRCTDLESKQKKMVLSLIAEDVTTFCHSCNLVKWLIMNIMLYLPTNGSIDYVEIIALIRKIYVDLIYEPNLIIKITDERLVSILVEKLNTEETDLKVKQQIIECLSVLASNSRFISNMLMVKASVEEFRKYFQNNRNHSEEIMMNFVSLIWAILPDSSHPNNCAFPSQENMREAKPIPIPIWQYKGAKNLWVNFTTSVNLEMERKFGYLNEFQVIYKKIVHTIDFRKMLIIDDALLKARPIRRWFVESYSFLLLKKMKELNNGSSISNCFSKLAFEVFTSTIFSSVHSDPKTYRSLEGLHSLMKFANEDQFFGDLSRQCAFAESTLLERLNDALHDPSYDFQISALKVIIILMHRDPKTYTPLFEQVGLITVIRCIAQDCEVEHQSNQPQDLDNTIEKKNWLKEQAEELIRQCKLDDNIIYPQVLKDSATMDDFDKVPMRTLFNLLLSSLRGFVRHSRFRPEILKYFINFLTSKNGPKDREQRLRYFLAIFAEIPQNAEQAEIQISRKKLEDLLDNLVLFILNFFSLKTPSRRSLLEAAGIDTLQTIVEFEFLITVHAENEILSLRMMPFKTIQYIASYVLHYTSIECDEEFKESVVDLDLCKPTLYLNGCELPPNITLYEAIRLNGKFVGNHSLFEIEHQLEFRCETPAYIKKESDSYSHPLDYILRTRTCCEGIPEEVTMALQFVDILYGLDKYWTMLYSGYQHQYLIDPEMLALDDFKNHLRIIYMDPFNALVGRTQPYLEGIVGNCPNVLDLNTREIVFKLLATDRRRALTIATTLCGFRARVFTQTDDPIIEVRRDHILDDIIEPLRNTGSFSEWRVTFKDEVGDGNGLKKELFTSVSRSLQKADLKIWTGSEFTETGYIEVEKGLYPSIRREVHEGQEDDIFSELSLDQKFMFIGTFLGKAIIEEQILDLPLAVPIFKWLLKEELTLDDLQYVNPAVHKVLQNLSEMVVSRDRLHKSLELSEDVRNELIQKIDKDREIVDSFYLNFVVPGEAESIELIPNGENTPVTLDNAHIYIERVQKLLLETGVTWQMIHLKLALGRIINLDYLHIFRPQELSSLICGTDNEEYWTLHHLRKFITIVGFHNNERNQVDNFLKLWSSANSKERLLFLEFVTGKSRLPIGGFREMNPTLTIQECDRPSYAQTCFNKLYLKKNMSPEEMRKFFQLAITEGLNYFGLA